MNKTMNDFIVSTPKILGGRPRINNTRVSVCSIAGWYRQGYSPEEISEQYEHLTLAQIYSALAYYHANKLEIERDIHREESEYERLLNEHHTLSKCA
ncbi:MAG: hypothetical protein BWK80_25300 [Desulfobacteraceae bacterium IS3]|nr:MAG: hypothetical protein BWK80_25300 [Desulfobacteraceae bacterium IS3]HAO19102.1 hypothetical protein [Desulfobacteraceae bacterium]